MNEKIIKFIFSLFILFACGELLLAQNITNTLGTTGTFRIKDGSTDYLTLSQSNGQVNILRSLRLESTTGPSTGVVYMGADKFLHNYGTGNTFLGLNAGNFTMTGNNNSSIGYLSLFNNASGYQNSSLGYVSLYSNTTGYQNSSFGAVSLYSNTSGYQNSSFGTGSLSGNTTGYQNSSFGSGSLSLNTAGYENSSFGYLSLNSNTTGHRNSTFGAGSLSRNTTGNNNSAFGYNSLVNNTTAAFNSAFGVSSLHFNTNGVGNSAFGFSALSNNTTGSNNTAVGLGSLSNITTGQNNIGIGYDAIVPDGTLSNQVRIGNAGITYAGIQVAWTVTSDRRLKENIMLSPLGLNFINKLNPVSYTRKNDEKKKTEFGLIAQEVDVVLKEEGIENAGILTVTNTGGYELRYNDLLAPMIKAIQELGEENKKLKDLSEELHLQNEDLEKRLAKLELIIGNENSKNEIKLSGK
ncbi:MAG: hypothetical protein HOP31_12880 [Ignavibacteria bacterium]|nr:hypothetical protein [Ignavibacteria bacterium]